MTRELFDLTDKVAIVTGGNGGIGLGIAKGLAGSNASVVVAARNADKTVSAVRELQALGSDASGVSLDVSDEESIKAAVAETVDRYGRLDILVNNAGTTVRKPTRGLRGGGLGSRAGREPARGVPVLPRGVPAHGRSNGAGRS